MVEVEWEVTVEDDADFVGGSRRQTTFLKGAWADLPNHARSTAAEVCRDYFAERRLWDDWFGDEREAGLRLRIHLPETIAGDYLIDVQLVPSAHCIKRIETACNHFPGQTECDWCRT